jgi:RNA polymerase sigma-70 factor (ECF subfamily)
VLEPERQPRRIGVPSIGFQIRYGLSLPDIHDKPVSTDAAQSGNNRDRRMTVRGLSVAVLSSVEISRLIVSVATRDTAAFEQLYAGTRAKLYGVVLRILRRHDLAADVLEQTYVEIWETAPEYDPAQAGALAWLVAIARRRAIDLARRPDTLASEVEPEIADTESPGVLPRREMTDDLKRLLTCIGRLEPDRQRMVLLAYYGAFSREQLALKLDTPVNLLKASLRRSLSEIEQCLMS